MISVGAVGGGAGGASAYYAGDNYYTAGEGTEQSAWMGAGAELLGLSGPVDATVFERVLVGQLPNGAVIKAPKSDLRPGLDMTFSVSKSVSLVAMLGGDHRLVEAFRESVAHTLGWIEKNMAEGRIMKDGKQAPERTGNLLAAVFMHDVSRENEPQMHAHAVTANATLMSDGKWRALHNDQLFKSQSVMGTVFNADYRARVEKLGFPTEHAKNPIYGSFEIAGVSRAAIEAFSKRSAQIEAYLTERGLQGTPAEREIAALATRSPKEPELVPEQRAEGWRALATELGLDAGKLVAAAVERAGRGETVWGQAMAGLRGVGERGMAVAARMGLTPRDGDQLVPERLGRLEPRVYAAAQAVASAVRDLGEREAAFDRLDLIRTALERGGPVTVADVEARMALLEGKGLLIGNDGRLMTTEGEVRLERSLLDGKRVGDGVATPIEQRSDAGPLAQEAARAIGLRRLSPTQQAAAELILGSTDRVVAVQGVAGAGKSAVLAPVAAIARAAGRQVIGLGETNKLARELGVVMNGEGRTISSFLKLYERVIDGTAGPDKLAEARTALSGALVVIDEASMVGTYHGARLIQLANRMDVGRLTFVGDTRQLAAIMAGKPFDQLQRSGTATAHMPENLRARSELMIAVNEALNHDKTPAGVAEAFRLLKPHTVEVAGPMVATTAAKMWAALPKAERDGTLLLASGLNIRAQANAAAQAELKKAGEITGKGVGFTVLDRVSSSKEGARYTTNYREGQVVEFRTALTSQGLARGDRGVVTGIKGDRVTLAMHSGGEKVFRPDKLPKNLKEDAVSVYRFKQVELHAGDRIRWTDTDRTRGIANADMARVEAVTTEGVTVSSLLDGQVHELGRGDRMLERLDLAYAINAHVAQGVTAEHGIVVMSARERNLASIRSFLVLVTRIVDKATLVVDDGRKLEAAVTRNAGDKTSALDVVRQGDAMDAIRLPDTRSPIDRAVERYAQTFAHVEQMRAHGSVSSPQQARELTQAAVALDMVRPNGADDMRIVLDRRPNLAREVAQGRLDEVRQAWVEEGRVRSDSVAYAERFVADWRAGSAALGSARGGSGEGRAERRMERLNDRMEREPALEQALDHRIPERQRQMDEPDRGGMGRSNRDIDFGR